MKYLFKKVFKKIKANTTQDLHQLLGKIGEIRPINYSLVKREQACQLLLPTLNTASIYGGAATAIIFSVKLAIFLGLKLKIVQTSKKGDASRLSLFLEENGVNPSSLNIEVIDISTRDSTNQILELSESDVVIASAWGDAYIAELLSLKNFIYLIQDYEPIFFPNSDLYLIAENTYRPKNLIGVCNTKLMYTFMKEKGYTSISEQALWFEPAVSRKNTGLAQFNQGKKNLFLYGRPGVPRNLFLIGLKALHDLSKEGLIDFSNWNLYMAGQSDIPSVKISNQVTIQNRGKMSLKDYIQFSKGMDVAISLMMSPHPNYPTLEFASIGAAVVTTRYANKISLADYSKNIVMADPSVESIKEAIVKACKISYEERIANVEHNNIPENWDESFKVVFPKIKDLIRL